MGTWISSFEARFSSGLVIKAILILALAFIVSAIVKSLIMKRMEKAPFNCGYQKQKSDSTATGAAVGKVKSG